MRNPLRFVLAVLLSVIVLVAVPQAATADSVRDREWHLSALDIATAQQITQGDGIVVAVADTGVDAKHVDLAGAVLPGKEFGRDGDGRQDTDGHGTAMAGIIAARGRPGGNGILGIAPKAAILPVRTLPGGDFGGDSALLGQGIAWAVAQGAKVICVAAVTDVDQSVETAIRAAVQADIVVVAGVGNTPKDVHVAFPARLPGVLAVGGTDRNGNHAAISATGPEVVLAAPAVDIISTGAFGDYETASGTSNSTAIVAGAVALVRAKYPALSAAEVIHRLTATATDKGKPGRDDEYGFGVVNLVAALTAEVPPLPIGAASPSASSGGSASTPGKTSQAGAVAVVGAVLLGAGGLLLLLRRRRSSGRNL